MVNIITHDNLILSTFHDLLDVEKFVTLLKKNWKYFCLVLSSKLKKMFILLS